MHQKNTPAAPGPPTVLVLGAYGLIGEEVVRGCLGRGWPVRGLGRDERQMRAPITWVHADLANLTEAGDWATLLSGVDVVINTAGALQDGPSGTVADVHTRAISALAAAAGPAGVSRIVQISAVGAEPDANTSFLTTKAEGDAAIRACGVDYVILKPGLVLGRSVYGGTALLRMLAAVPLIQPLAHGDAVVQVVGMQDLVLATLSAADASLPSGTEADLVSDERIPSRTLLTKIRAWLGFTPARATIELPALLTALVGRVADALGRLGWRSPLRTTALMALRAGVPGDASQWCAIGGQPLDHLESILAAERSTLQDRWHARLSLLFPLIIAVLALFWMVSGLIGLFQVSAAKAVLSADASTPTWAGAAVIAGGVIDVALGLGVLVKRHARLACLGMIAVSLGYLLFGTLLVPGLWADPLGPYVKIFPGIVLAAAALALLQDR